MFFFVLLLGYVASSTAIHKLRYVTVVTSEIRFTFGELDGERRMYYGSNVTEVILQKEWINVSAFQPRYWTREKDRMRGEYEDLQHHLNQISNQTIGHTLEMMYGCVLYDNGTTTGFHQYSYDYSSVKHGTWAAEILSKWDPRGHHVGKLMEKCCEQLKKFGPAEAAAPGISSTVGDLDEEHDSRMTEGNPATESKKKNDTNKPESDKPVVGANVYIAVAVIAVGVGGGLIIWYVKRKTCTGREETRKREQDIPLNDFTCVPVEIPPAEVSLMMSKVCGMSCLRDEATCY